MIKKQRAIKVDDEEWSRWQAQAKSAGVTVGEWVRQRCGGGRVEPKPGKALYERPAPKPSVEVARVVQKVDSEVVGAPCETESVKTVPPSQPKHIYAQFNNEVAPSKHKWSTPPNPPKEAKREPLGYKAYLPPQEEQKDSKSVPNIPGVARGSDLTKSST